MTENTKYLMTKENSKSNSSEVFLKMFGNFNSLSGKTAQYLEQYEGLEYHQSEVGMENKLNFFTLKAGQNFGQMFSSALEKPVLPLLKRKLEHFWITCALNS